MKGKRHIYMDYHATTPLDERALEAMLPYLREKFGNAASQTHRFGWDALDAVEAARVQTARILGARPEEIVFTSGATESNNLAIKGVCEKHAAKGRHIITVATEHKAVLDCFAQMEKRDFETTILDVRPDGLLDIEELRAALRDDTILVSVMAANNEIGVLQPIEEIGARCKERGVLFHTDAAQAVGKVPFNVENAKADLVSISAHKVYGPKGIGALYVRGKHPRVSLDCQLHGGGHERGLRSGTLNVPAIVGMGKALEIAQAELEEESRRVLALREKLRQGLAARLDHITVHGDLQRRLPGNLNVGFAYVEGETLLMRLDDIAVSSGSACTSADPAPSHVLAALGVSVDLAQASIRFGLGRFTTEEEVDYAIEKTVRVVRMLREQSPHYDLARQGLLDDE
ncbi:IscS subfamily cysteine desulfurase [Candidatus Sumerlaeota bacterium]|nr:IscS subfamily cysteine desulfurase [Candidatus Sumerlaeota bacterium]